MKSQPIAFMLSDLGITKSHSRPYVNYDNPFSESQFKTLKYSPDFPNRFNSMAEAREFCRNFFNWYKFQHYHSGILLLTPESVHYGFVNDILVNWKDVLKKAFEENPKRFRKKLSVLKNLPESVWINNPENIEKDAL